MAPHDQLRTIIRNIPDKVISTLVNCDCICFDVDSTMLTCEGIDELAKSAGKSEEVKAITRKAMGGNMSFRESLTKRLNIIQPSKALIDKMVVNEPPTVTPGFTDLVNAFRSRGTEVFLVSGGFDALIIPAAARCGIPADHVIANHIQFDEEGKFAGFDKTRFTSESMGKAKALQYLKNTHNFSKMVMVGDGMTDSEARPPADIFIGFGGNVCRDAVKEVSDIFVTDFNSILEIIQSYSS